MCGDQLAGCGDKEEDGGRKKEGVFSFYIALIILGIGVCGVRLVGCVECGDWLGAGLVGKGWWVGNERKAGGVGGKGTARVLFCSAMRRK